MKCESRSVRTVTTRFRDDAGNVSSHKKAELSGKSVRYEGEHSETDSEVEEEHAQKGARAAAHSQQQAMARDPSFFRRQKVLVAPNIELKPTECDEFGESLEESGDMTAAQLQAKIDSHLLISAGGGGAVGDEDPLARNVISDVNNDDERSDSRVIESRDERTGLAIQTNIDSSVKSRENLKVCKSEGVVDVRETDEAIVKKITTKTRTTKSVVKTTTKTTTKKGTLD